MIRNATHALLTWLKGEQGSAKVRGKEGGHLQGRLEGLTLVWRGPEVSCRRTKQAGLELRQLGFLRASKARSVSNPFAEPVPKQIVPPAGTPSPEVVTGS